jgi:hypothetical protein
MGAWMQLKLLLALVIENSVTTRVFSLGFIDLSFSRWACGKK